MEKESTFYKPHVFYTYLFCSPHMEGAGRREGITFLKVASIMTESFQSC